MSKNTLTNPKVKNSGRSFLLLAVVLLGSLVIIPIGGNPKYDFGIKSELFFFESKIGTDDNIGNSFFSKIITKTDYIFEKISRYIPLYTIYKMLEDFHHILEHSSNSDDSQSPFPDKSPSFESPTPIGPQDIGIDPHGNGLMDDPIPLKIDDGNTVDMSALLVPLVKAQSSNFNPSEPKKPFAEFHTEGPFMTLQTIIFSAIGSYDPNGSILEYFWDFGDGHKGSGPIVSHEYRIVGTHTVTLTIFNNDGQSNTADVAFYVKPNSMVRSLRIDNDVTPPIIALTGTNIQKIFLGEHYTELGVFAYDEVDGVLTPYVKKPSTNIRFVTPGYYEMTYEVSDSAGNVAKASRYIHVIPHSYDLFIEKFKNYIENSKTQFSEF